MKKRILSLLILFLLLFNVGIFAEEATPETTENTTKVEQSSTETEEKTAQVLFDLDKFEEAPFKFSDYKGKNILISMFTTWCTYCKTELPEFKRYQEEHPEDVVMLMVHVPAGETFETAQAFWKDNSLEGLTLLQDNGFLSKAFSVQGFPTNLIFDKEGKIRKYTYALSYEALDEEIKAIKASEEKEEVK